MNVRDTIPIRPAYELGIMCSEYHRISVLHNVAFCDSLTLWHVLDTAQQTVDNSLDSSIIVSIRRASRRNSTLRLISGWMVRCVP